MGHYSDSYDYDAKQRQKAKENRTEVDLTAKSLDIKNLGLDQIIGCLIGFRADGYKVGHIKEGKLFIYKS